MKALEPLKTNPTLSHSLIMQSSDAPLNATAILIEACIVY